MTCRPGPVPPTRSYTVEVVPNLALGTAQVVPRPAQAVRLVLARYNAPAEPRAPRLRAVPRDA